jgi:hypothetical protein
MSKLVSHLSVSLALSEVEFFICSKWAMAAARSAWFRSW